MYRVKQRYIRQVKMITAMLEMQLKDTVTTPDTDFPRNFSRVPGSLVTVEATPEFFLKMAVRAMSDYSVALAGGNPYEDKGVYTHGEYVREEIDLDQPTWSGPNNPYEHPIQKTIETQAPPQPATDQADDDTRDFDLMTKEGEI